MINRYKELLKEVSKEHNEQKTNHSMIEFLSLMVLISSLEYLGAVPALNDDGEHCGGVTGFLLSTAQRLED